MSDQLPNTLIDKSLIMLNAVTSLRVVKDSDGARLLIKQTATGIAISTTGESYLDIDTFALSHLIATLETYQNKGE